MPKLPNPPHRVAIQWFVVLAFVSLLRVPFASAQLDTCRGDCSHDGVTTAAEVLNGVSLALGSAAVQCAALDANQDGRVSIDEILGAVTDAAIRCPAPVPGAQGSDFTQKASRLAVATIDDLGIIDFGFAGANGASLTAALPELRWRLANHARSTATGVRNRAATGGGGSVVIRCQSGNATLGDCTANTRTVTYNHCRFPAGTETVERNGVLTQHFDRSESCANLELDQDFNPVIRANVGVTQQFTGSPEFTETVFASNGTMRLQRRLSLTRSVQPSSGGCVGISGTETLDGSLHFECQPAAGDSDCTTSIADVTLRVHGLQLNRQSAGTPCMLTMTADGELDVDNTSTGEAYVQNFRALRITEMHAGGDSVMTEDGTMITSCLGKVTLQTLDSANQSLRFAPGATCPLQGLLAVTSTASSTSAASAGTIAGLESAAASGGGGASGSTLANQGYRDIAFRAANGPVYQILQNIDGAPDIGAEDVRITTVVGSQDATLGDPVGQCSGGNIESVVSAAGIAFPPNAVFSSGPVTDATVPCFNPNARDGAGRVCIGPDCSRPDCECPIGACTTFSLRNGGPPITQTALAATLENTLASEASDVCRSSERPGRAAYGFGSSGPTTATHVCSARPDDGFTLSAGSSIVFAYDTGLLNPFDAGSAGFFIDHDGSNPVSCSGPDKVVGVVAVDRNPIPPPRIRYAPSAVHFDFNGDDKFDDKTLASCLHAPLLQCNGAALPTATPTPQQPPRCQPIDLGMADPIDAPIERTLPAGGNQANTFGGATCGDGGNRAPDVVFQYRAAVDGYYVIDTRGSSFDTVLYVRDSVCTGPELACNDDASDGDTGSLVGLSLHQDDRIIIIVDGSGTASGTVQLKLSRSLAPPTPTATTTPDLSALPDLIVAALTAPSDGIVGARINVTSMVKNNGASDAGQFQVAFVYASNPELTDGLKSSGYACVIPGLAPGTTAPCSGSITVPMSLTNGIHYVGVVADSSDDVRESIETNNLKSAMISLTSGPNPPTPTTTQTHKATSFSATPTPTRSPQPTATPSPKECDPHNQCVSNGMCKPDGTCGGMPLTGGSCDTGDACEVNGHCVSGTCMGDPAPIGTGCASGCGTCDELIPGLHLRFCKPLAEQVGQPCDPKLGACFTGVCQGPPITFCAVALKQCPDTDHNVCTSDSCNPATGLCEHTDQSPCVPQCETCTPGVGCMPANIGAPCDNLDECPVESSCQVLSGRGLCLAGTPSSTLPTATPTLSTQGLTAVITD